MLPDSLPPNGIAFDALFEASPNPYVVLDAALTIVWMNEAYLRVTMRTRDELTGRAMFDAFPSDPDSAHGQQLRQSLRRVLREGQRDHTPLIRYDIARPDGTGMEERYWSATHTPFPDEEGRVRFILQHTVDVTELHRLRTAAETLLPGSAYPAQIQGAIFSHARTLQASSRVVTEERDQLRRLFEQAPGFMAMLHGPDHVCTLANEALAVFLGRDIVGRPVREAMPDFVRQGLLDLLDEVYATGRPFVGRGIRIMVETDPEGPEEERYVDFVYQPIQDAEGTVTGIFVQGHDLTEQKRAERALHESEQRFRLVAESAPVMLWMSGVDGRCLYLNRTQRDFSGVSMDDVSEFDWSAYLHPDDRDEVVESYRRALQHQAAFSSEARFRRFDGAYRILRTDAHPRLGPADEVVGMIGVNVDVTERRRAEAALQEFNETLEQQVAERTEQLRRNEDALRQAQKMEAVGRLTGGVAHDFNNLLQVVAGNLQLLSKHVAGNEKAEKRVRQALEGVDRGAKLASQLLAFGRRQPLVPKAVDIGRLVASLDDMLRRALGEEIALETVVADGLWNTMVDPTQVDNALLNLAINARDAMDGRGNLTIEASNAVLNDHYAVCHDVTAGQYVMVAVTDTGCGMSAEVIQHAFDPFFTTKPEGLGTGLGLSQVYGFARQSGGHVSIYSEPGEGTTIRLYLPRSQAEVDAPRPIDPGAVAGGTETILVVEDDRYVRTTVVEMLADLGYQVLKAEDAQSALTLLEDGAEVDLLFTDVVMPGPLRSIELAAKARLRLPDIEVLFTSGYTENAIFHDGRLDEGVDLLSKPYTREALARKIREMLRRRKERRAAGGPSTASDRPELRESGARGLCVLLVEDDALVRLSTAEMLSGLGYSVIEAADASEALSAVAESEIDILLTDIGLPDLPGTVLAERIRERLPALPVIFASGYDELPASGTTTAAIPLRKPYDEKRLAAALVAARGP